VSTLLSGLLPGEELVDVAHVPDGARLRLVRKGSNFTILLDDNELMNSYNYASEEALATMTCERLGPRADLQMLVGGYGMGFTLRAALATLGHDAAVTVSEILPEILDWAAGPMRVQTAGCLDDPRTSIVHEDVAVLIAGARRAYDAILLDVDNGPEGLTRQVNDWLYSRSGLEAAMSALRPKGILAIWSATPDASFAALLSEIGFSVAVVPVPASPIRLEDSGEIEHVVIFAQLR